MSHSIKNHKNVQRMFIKVQIFGIKKIFFKLEFFHKLLTKNKRTKENKRKKNAKMFKLKILI